MQFSVFPCLLLLLTLFRLSLNLASSRRILLHGNEGSAAAGQVIEAFGQFVVGGNYVVGFVLFLALIAIQYMVINHGAVRIAEVTARFTLDALPGKQMAIDADLDAGLIDETQARQRREAVSREAEFYGAMDGAARFNQRDSLATVLITAINIIAGFLIGVFQLDIPFREALKTYTILTVGDGLVTMIPSLLVSVAGGMVATRASSDESLGIDLGSNLLRRSRPLWIVSGVMGTLALIPGLPKIPFPGAGVDLAPCWRAASGKRGRESAGSGSCSRSASRRRTPQETLESLLKLDDLSLEVGYGLVPLVDQAGRAVAARMRALRRHLALQLGFIVPPVHITDNLQLKPREYVIRLRGVEIARWEMTRTMLAGHQFGSDGAAAAGTRNAASRLSACRPTGLLPTCATGRWLRGYAVVDQTSVLATHLAEVIKQHAHELLTRQETKRLLDRLGESHPKLVRRTCPQAAQPGRSAEGAAATAARAGFDSRPGHHSGNPAGYRRSAANRNPVLLVEAARQALGRALVRPLLAEDGGLRVVTLDPEMEEELDARFRGAAGGDQSGGAAAFVCAPACWKG